MNPSDPEVIAAEQERSLRRFVSGTGAPDVPADPAFQPGVWTTEPFDVCP